MKKVLVLFSILTMILSGATSVSASSKKTIEEVKESVNSYDQSIVNDLLNSGLSYDDAVYHAKVDKLVKGLEENNIAVKIDPNTEDISDDYVRLNKKQFQNDFLALKDGAVKKSLISINNLMTTGVDELNKFMKKQKNDSYDSKYTLEYPDGSSLTVTSGATASPSVTDDRIQANQTCSGTQMTPNVTGPWNSTSCISYESSLVYDLNGGSWPNNTTWNGDAWTEWSFSSPGSYSKLKDLFGWSWKGTVSGGYLTYGDASIRYDSGTASSYGVVLINTEYLSNSNTNGDGTNKWVQGYTDVLFEVTGSFSASYGILSVSVNTGGQWHQYAIDEVNGWSDVHHYAATYK